MGVLLVRFGSLGDVILAGAAGQALARQRPDLDVTFLVKEEYADLVRAQPWARAVWTLGAADQGAPAATPALREKIRAGDFSAVVDLQTSPRSRALLAGHARVFSWNAERWRRRRWVSLRWTRPHPVRPAWLRFVDALAPLGIDAALAEPPRLLAPPEAVAQAHATLAEWPGGPITFLAPGARWPTKRWPEERFIEVGRRIAAGGGRVLIGGDASDRTALPALDRWAQGEPAARWYEGPLTGLLALVRCAGRAITNDTGLMHLAAAAGVRVTAVFGSTHPALGFAPAGDGHHVLCAGLNCQPCTLHGRERCPLGHHDCVRRIEVETVFKD
jgi:heptosyltransferase-2